MYPSNNTQSADPISQITDEAGRVTLQDGAKVAKTDVVAADIDAEIEEMMRENGIMEYSVLPADDPEDRLTNGGMQPLLRIEGPSYSSRRITVPIRRQLLE